MSTKTLFVTHGSNASTVVALTDFHPDFVVGAATVGIAFAAVYAVVSAAIAAAGMFIQIKVRKKQHRAFFLIKQDTWFYGRGKGNIF